MTRIMLKQCICQVYGLITGSARKKMVSATRTPFKRSPSLDQSPWHPQGLGLVSVGILFVQTDRVYALLRFKVFPSNKSTARMLG